LNYKPRATGVFLLKGYYMLLTLFVLASCASGFLVGGLVAIVSAERDRKRALPPHAQAPSDPLYSELIDSLRQDPDWVTNKGSIEGVINHRLKYRVVNMFDRVALLNTEKSDWILASEQVGSWTGEQSKQIMALVRNITAAEFLNRRTR
jgi:cytochrome c-type biogenesis protein CcmH/NrfG